jgi:hypothetical protein
MVAVVVAVVSLMLLEETPDLVQAPELVGLVLVGLLH